MTTGSLLKSRDQLEISLTASTLMVMTGSDNITLASTEEESSEGEELEVEEEVDPFEEAAAEAARREVEKAKRKSASKAAPKKKKGDTSAPTRETVTSTPAPRSKKASRPAAGDESVVVVDRGNKSSKEKTKKLSSKSANSGRSTGKKNSRPSPPPRDEDSSEDGSEGEEDEIQEDSEEASSSAKKRSRRDSGSGSSESGNDAMKLLEGLMSLSKKKRRKSKKKSKKRSRSSSSSSASSSDPEDEETVLTDKQFKLRDNGEDILDMNTRHILRTPTAAPEVWWKAPFRSRVSRPIRGSGLNMEPSLGHARIHDTTIRRCHDRCALLSTKMLLSKNADVSIRDSKVMKISGDKVSLDRKWAQVEAVWEIAEAVSNYVTLIHYTRNYSYEGIALSRALHDFGWFLGICSNEREQIELLELGIDKVLARNSQRARTNLPPMSYEQIRAALR